MRRNTKIGIGIIIVVAVVVFFGAPIMPVQWITGAQLNSVGLSGNNVIWCFYPCTQVTAAASPSFVFLNCGMLGGQYEHCADCTTLPAGARWICGTPP